MSGVNCGKEHGTIERTVKKIKNIKKKKMTRNNVRARLKKEAENGEY